MIFGNIMGFNVVFILYILKKYSFGEVLMIDEGIILIFFNLLK